MKNQPVSPLRQRMIEDMKLRNLAPSTQYIYLKAVEKFSVHFSCSPDELDFEDARQYQLDMVSRGLQATTINAAMYSCFSVPEPKGHAILTAHRLCGVAKFSNSKKMKNKRTGED